MPTLQRNLPSTRQTVIELKQDNSDFEWYPTTNEMINVIRDDLINEGFDRCTDGDLHLSILDIGAGDGRVLRKLTKGERYAIEKSHVHLESIKSDTFIIGTDFEQQTILDKSVSAIFCNPPYSSWEGWVNKIIKEANAPLIYLVIPQRWEKSKVIADAIELRRGEASIIWEGDFLQAERQARAKVHIVKINLQYTGRHHYSRTREIKTDPFDVWFEEHFSINAKASDHDSNNADLQKDSTQTAINTPENQALIKQEGLAKVLERLYNRDLTTLLETYKKIEELNPVLLGELGVSVDGVKGALKLRIKGLKDLYWRELFDRLESITDRLTASSRETMLSKLMSNTSVDFSAQNAHAIILWVIKNANEYFDSQLVSVMESMITHSNVVLYTSNRRTIRDEDWKYGRQPTLERYKLDYRIVLHNKGGIDTGYFRNEVKGISGRAGVFLDDLMTIARNVGFDTVGMSKSKDLRRHWDSGRSNVFEYRCTKTGNVEVLFEAKAFYNQNLHVRFNQAFICALNCEFGRLKGWLKSREQASEELDIPLSKTTHFGINTKLVSAAVLPLLNHVA